MTVILHHGDAVQWARDYEGELFHAAFCDAPYEMAFMSKGWDASGVAFDPETWRAFARVLHPGAFLFVFAGTINDDLISVAMREAGLRKFHKMQGWCYGSGFPKASRIDTQIDKAAGAERTETIERPIAYPDSDTWGVPNNGGIGNDKSMFNVGAVNKGGTRTVSLPATDLARTWAGHRYGLQALKPALETVLIFQKPYDGRPVDNITQTGAGSLWIDGARIGLSDGETAQSVNKGATKMGGMFGNGKPVIEKELTGRWPSNFYLGSDEAARRLDEQSGYSVSKPHKGAQLSGAGTHEGWRREAHKKDFPKWSPHDDSGGASRFFFRVSEQIDEADPVRYCAKASRSERDAGCDAFPEKEWTLQGRQGLAGRERLDDSAAPLKAGGASRNPHPTIKPLALTRYLATLLLPPAEYAPRRIFVPFSGVASEIVGCFQAGWEHVEGVELTEEYLPIARARVEYWQKKAVQRELL